MGSRYKAGTHLDGTHAGDHQPGLQRRRAITGIRRQRQNGALLGPEDGKRRQNSRQPGRRDQLPGTEPRWKTAGRS